MGRTVSAIETDTALIVELVGPAGAGKTTLLQALCRRDKTVLAGPELELRRIGHSWIFVRHIPFLAPLLLRTWRSSRPFTWEEMKTLVYLKGWPTVLKAKAGKSCRVVLLDQGPVFKLAMLNAFGPASVRDRRCVDWWNSMYAQWASALDMVIHLGAPGELLVERINHRQKWHLVKGKSFEEASEFLARYQSGCEQVLEELTANGSLTLLHLDTGTKTVEQMVDEVLCAWNSIRGPR